MSIHCVHVCHVHVSVCVGEMQRGYGSDTRVLAVRSTIVDKLNKELVRIFYVLPTCYTFVECNSIQSGPI